MAADDPKRGGREFVLDTLVVAVTQILLKLRGLVTLPLIVKLLGTASYGVFTQVITFSGLASALLAWNLHLPLVRFMVVDRARWGSIYATLMSATAASVGVGAALLALFARPLGDVLIGGSDGATYLLLSLALVFAANVRQINLNVYRATERFVLRSAVELATTFGELVGIYLLIRYGRGLTEALAFAAMWEGLAALVTTVHAARVTGWGPLDRGILARALAFALPLVPGSLATWMLDRADRFVVNAYLGSRGVGVYAANYTLASFVLLFQAPFQMTLFPKVSALWDTDRARAERYISVSNRVFLTLAIAFVAGAAALAPALFTHLGNAEIARESDRITLLLELGVLGWGTASMLMHALYGANRTRMLAVVTLSAAALNLLLNFALVPAWGVVGAAVATLVAYAAVFVPVLLAVRAITHVRYDLSYLARCAIAAGVMAAGLRWLDPRGVAALAAASVGGIVAYFAILWVLGGITRADVAAAADLLRRV